MRSRRPHLAAALLAALALSAPAAPVAQAHAPGTALYRVAPAKRVPLEAWLRRGIDVAGRGPDGALHAFASPADAAAAAALGLVLEPLDLQARGPLGAPAGPAANPNLGAYHTVAEALAEMAAYAASHPTLARLDTLGVSVEGRPLVAIEITDHPGVDEGEPRVLVAGCHHARELMSVELPLYLMRRLLDGYGADPTLTNLVDGRDIWILPVVNPDGHVYVEQHSGGQSDTWWRKNRRANADGSYGVDLNRNYGYLWGYDDYGSSPVPASETFRGTGPFSEPETSAIRSFLAGRPCTIAISFHSYGELFLYPWGYDRLDTPDHDVFEALGDSVAAQNGYLAGNPRSGAIYLTNGDMDDWVYGDVATKPRLFGFTFELNRSDQGGFAPNDNLIGPTSELNWGPMLTLLRFADRPRRVVPPARLPAPVFVAQGSGMLLSWAQAAPDTANPAVRHEVRRMDAALRVVDDAEGGVADWDTLGFSWSASRAASGVRSYWSGSGDARRSLLAARASFDASSGESLVVRAFWDFETYYDWWYAEGSDDGGATWTRLAGDRTTNADPFGYNDGNGITGTSGGVFARAAFSLAPFAGTQVLVRFRTQTDAAVHGEGLYLDDLDPTGRYQGLVVTDTGSPIPATLFDPAPAVAGEYQVRAVDAEGQAGVWSDRTPYAPGVTAVAGESGAVAARTTLAVFPNPLNPGGTVRANVAMPAGGRYRLTLHDAQGRRVARLGQGRASAPGVERTFRFEGRSGAGAPLPSGVYFLRLEFDGGAVSRKVTVLR